MKLKHDPFGISWKVGDTPTKDSCRVNVVLSPQLSEYLACWAASLGKSRGQVIRKILQDRADREQSLDSILADLADLAAQSWEKERTENPEISFLKYKNELYRTLRRRGLSEESITKVFQMLNARVNIDEEE